MGGMTDRKELVGITLYLLFDASSYTSGENFIIDGGFITWLVRK
jgi:hypothetical protein